MFKTAALALLSLFLAGTDAASRKPVRARELRKSNGGKGGKGGSSQDLITLIGETSSSLFEVIEGEVVDRIPDPDEINFCDGNTCVGRQVVLVEGESESDSCMSTTFVLVHLDNAYNIDVLCPTIMGYTLTLTPVSCEEGTPTGGCNSPIGDNFDDFPHEVVRGSGAIDLRSDDPFIITIKATCCKRD